MDKGLRTSWPYLSFRVAEHGGYLHQLLEAVES
jgi:hypothetical protein